MTLLSFAQNGEDVVLWRALGDVAGGCYIDAGACDPDVDSVTRAFYDRGWRGINIEPNPLLHARLVRARPDDVNLAVGLGATAGVQTLHVLDTDSGLSTFVADIADVHRTAGIRAEPMAVAVVPLAEVCRAHVRGPIHFLKIDVEGSERAVLEGADFGRWRPWVVVVEATFPNTQRPTHDAWEPLLLAADYRFVLFDGLNRFYVAAEQAPALADRLAYPACVFDDYVTARQQAGWDRAAAVEAIAAGRDAAAAEQLAALREALAGGDQRIADLGRQVAAGERRIADLETRLAAQAAAFVARPAAVKDSRGWRAMRPIRWLARLRRGGGGGAGG